MTGTSRQKFGTWLAVLLAVIVAAPAAAQQNAVISGAVTTDQGQPLHGANVFINELSLSVSTNEAGRYVITVPAARVDSQMVQVRVRRIGYFPESRPVAVTPGAQTLNFELRADVARLNEVVVTGVAEGTERAKLAFAVTKIDASDMPAPAMNPLSQLQGRVPGANIVSASGRPGAAPQVLLRAPTSINASGRGQDPLYIVDGIILAGGLPDINPSDIESVEVVRGAAAASLYGARAGNGVIQITTKSGRSLDEGTMKFNARTEYGTSDIENRFGLAQNHIYRMNADGSAFCAQTAANDPACTETFDWASEVLRLNSTSTAVPAAPMFAPRNNGTTVWNTFQIGEWPGPTYNAIDQVVDPGAYSQTDVQASGRFSNTSFFSSIGYLNQEGSFIGLNGFQRSSFRLNVEQKISSDWNVAFTTYYSKSKSDGRGQEGGSFFDLTRMPRGVNLLMKDTVRHEYIIRPDLQGENENPVYSLVYQDREDDSDRFLGGVDVNYRPSDWFSVKGNVSYDRSATLYGQFNDKSFRTARNSSLNTGQVFESNESAQNFNGSVTASAKWSPMSDLNTMIQGRYLYEQQDYTNANFTGRSLLVKGVPAGDNASTDALTIGSGESSVRQVGFFLIGNVDYKDRYILDALIRRDGASVFGPDNRWATFGRVAAAWRVSEEPWFAVPAVDEFKLRYSVGTAGNRPRYSAQYEVYQLSSGSFSPLTGGNSELGPELVTEQEAGFDAVLFDRVSASLTYSNVVTKDQILNVPLPAASGFRSQWQNAGTLEGKTWEASLDIPWVRTADLSFNTHVHYDMSKAIITALKVPPFQYGAASNQGLEAAFYAREGERLGTIYGTKFATSCADLPSGTDCSQYRTNSDGYFVWTGGADPGSGASRAADGSVVVAPGTWGTAGPTLDGRLTPVMWGAPIIAQNAAGETYLPLGNTLPDYRFAVAPTLTYKKFSASAILDASIGQEVYNQGRHWSYFESYSADQDQGGRPDAELKPSGYYGSGNGLYNVLQPNSHFVEDASYMKLRELSVSYHLGTFGREVGDWTVSLIGRNLKTWTDYSGFDPEVGIADSQSNTRQDAGSGVINAFDAYRFPNLRTVTFALSASF